MTLQPCKTRREMPYKKGDRVFFFDYYHYQTADKIKLATVTDDQSCFVELNIQVDGEENIGERWGLGGERRVKVRDIFDIYDDRDYTLEATTTTTAQATTTATEEEIMSADQIAQLQAATTRKAQIQVLKALRAAGVKVLVKLNATTEAIAAEVSRLLALAANVVAEGVKSAVKVASIVVKANLAYLASQPVKPLNTRAVKGAIALSLKLFGV